MQVGQITAERAELAIANQEPGSNRLFHCRTVRCRVCGFVDHGRSISSNHSPRLQQKRRDPMTGRYLPVSELCYRCESPDTEPADHYHLAAAR